MHALVLWLFQCSILILHSWLKPLDMVMESTEFNIDVSLVLLRIDTKILEMFLTICKTRQSFNIGQHINNLTFYFFLLYISKYLCFNKWQHTKLIILYDFTFIYSSLESDHTRDIWNKVLTFNVMFKCHCWFYTMFKKLINKSHPCDSENCRIGCSL